jgi:hypothetical protein
MPDLPDLRASDHDREQAAAALSAHYAAGRLDDGELDERLNAVYAARTESDLAAILADLPPLPASQLQARAQFAARRRRLQRRTLQESGGGLVPFGICTAVWAASGGGYFWPLWVLIAVLVPLLRNGWALYGPDPDLDKVESELGPSSRQRERHAERQARAAEQRYEQRRPPNPPSPY